jgi:hypothetical protein
LLVTIIAYVILQELDLAKDPRLLLLFLPISIPLIWSYVKSVSGKIVVDVKNLEKEYQKEPSKETLQNEIDNLKKSEDSKIRERQRKYFQARSLMIDRTTIQSLTKLNKSQSFAQKELDEIYYSRNQQRELRDLVHKITDRSWKILATEATYTALELPDSKQLTGTAEHMFYSDLYLYLNAWLVSSIDNNVAEIIPYMPIDDIPPRYPSQDHPAINYYIEACDILCRVFEEGQFERLIRQDQRLTTQEQKICIRLGKYMNELSRLIQECQSTAIRSDL